MLYYMMNEDLVEINWSFCYKIKSSLSMHIGSIEPEVYRKFVDVWKEAVKCYGFLNRCKEYEYFTPIDLWNFFFLILDPNQSTIVTFLPGHQKLLWCFSMKTSFQASAQCRVFSTFPYILQEHVLASGFHLTALCRPKWPFPKVVNL